MNLPRLDWKPAILALPIFFALLCHAITLDRWWLAIPSAVCLVFAILQSKKRDTTSRQWYIVIGAGLIVGLVFPAADVSAGPLPPAAAAALTGVAIALALYAVYTGNTTVAWSAGWALVSISGKDEFGQGLRPALISFLLASLVAAAIQAKLLRGRLSQWLVLSLFVATLSVSTLGIAALVQRINRVFLSSVQNFSSKDSPVTVTGLGNSMLLSAKSTITPSMDPLLELSQSTGLLRATVMDKFDGIEWTTSPELKTRIDAQFPTPTRASGDRDIELFLLDDLNNSVPSPAGSSATQDVQVYVQGGWILRGKPNGVSVSLTGDHDELLPSEQIQKADYLAVPEELMNGLGPIAKELTAGVDNNLGKAERITEFFQREFKYSLSTDLLSQEHPLVTLVSEKRDAYCVYFASAMAMMLRTQGVPTRIVSGYVPGEINPLSGRVTIRGRDAHAWVEAWSPTEERFVAFDPTPSSSRQESMGHNNTTHFITAVIGMIRSAARRVWLLLRHQPSMGIAVLLMSPIFWIGLGLAMASFAWYRFRHASPKPAEITDAVDPRIRAIYDQYLGALRKKGFVPTESETDDEMLARIETLQQGPLTDAAKTFLHEYRVARFGTQTQTSDQDLETLARLNLTADATH